MIFYYSGTGNSRYVANELSRLTDDTVVNISPLRGHQLPQKIIQQIALSVSVGFVFPVYSWGPAPAMVEFVKSLPTDCLRGKYCWMACTCGDETGTTHRKFAKVVRSRGGNLDAMFSVIMPNNYVLLPGFGVDSKEVEQQKLSDAPARLKQITETVKNRDMAVDLHCGSMPRIRSLAYPLFKKWGVMPGKWHYTDACIGCGKCASICPSCNITMVESEGRKHPVWGKDCLSCCACFHICPTRAAQYGTITRRAGQYICPLK